jgi:hypothetical protein
MDLEAHITQHPMLMIKLLPGSEQRLLQLIIAAQVELVGLADSIALNHGIR